MYLFPAVPIRAWPAFPAQVCEQISIVFKNAPLALILEQRLVSRVFVDIFVFSFLPVECGNGKMIPEGIRKSSNAAIPRGMVPSPPLLLAGLCVDRSHFPEFGKVQE